MAILLNTIQGVAFFLDRGCGGQALPQSLLMCWGTVHTLKARE